MDKSVYRWFSHKYYNERRGWYIHSISQWRAAIRGNTNKPTLFQLQNWRGSNNSCCTYHQVQSSQRHSSRIPDWCPLSVTSFDEWQPTSAWTGVIHHPNPLLQWIPSHYGVNGNEQADRLATHGAGQQQPANQVCLTEMKTIIKSLFKTPQQQYSYNQLTRFDHNNIFRLRTGHNRLNQHLNRVMKIISSPMCSRGEAEQDTAHILQTCKNHQALWEEIWT